ncbi:MAG: hypothetical protein D6780_07840, partial [Candidatus Dadabacteria bacterium]
MEYALIDGDFGVLFNTALASLEAFKLYEAEILLLSAHKKDPSLFWRLVRPESFCQLVSASDKSIQQWGAGLIAKLSEAAQKKGFPKEALSLHTLLPSTYFNSKLEWY